MGKNGLSSITKKLIMAISGAGLVLFMLFHGAMNVVSIISQDGYRWICEFLGANWYALVGTMGLAALMALHFIYAFVLSYQNYKARGRQRYAVNERPEGVSWASKNMLAIGVVVLFGLVFHLYDFWAKMQLAEIRGNAPVDGIDQIKFIFSNNYFSIMYLLWLVAIWFHLSHGIASVMQSIGWNNLVWKRRIEILGSFFAAIIVMMFMSVVIYYWLIV
ncbi:MAG: succinate dehydrogenase/fumarate reductase cytochrome b subunit [Bacteroidales bacterium]|nr:succinate dehydrogenase/fumarate reductase cytochrome b subunit [Bacteroidales bacterium]MBO7528421.1 succinate dehydrogenase/fumarate reductase cytochrome b subunit [Bacteroidales bacterium]MBQ3843872.1 succinate dehydrogenase/fumarate reductase cytochrome b subunit [Bacteroidales bacterium]